jgi:hypothetical protein
VHVGYIYTHGRFSPSNNNNNNITAAEAWRVLRGWGTEGWRCHPCMPAPPGSHRPQLRLECTAAHGTKHFSMGSSPALASAISTLTHHIYTSFVSATYNKTYYWGIGNRDLENGLPGSLTCLVLCVCGYERTFTVTYDQQQVSATPYN